VVAEAYGRLFSAGDTLGVVAAGNAKDRYGTGPSGKGAWLYSDENPEAAKLPCGLPLVRTLNVPVQEGGRTKPWRPDLDWDNLKLLCVAATTSNESRLASFSGFGSAAVDIAAPGKAIATASRPRARNSGGVQRDVYANADGTSFASPMVAGAAALLRQAAPKAPMREIATALRRGARPVPALTRKVGYGQLDVACALDWLAREARRRQTDWDLVATLGDPDFVAATAKCPRKRPIGIQTTLRIAKSELYSDARRSNSLTDLLAAKGLDGGEASNSLAWQRTLLRSRGIEWDKGRAIFAIGSGRALDPAGGPAVYDAGRLVLACTDEGFRLSAIAVRFEGAIKPQGWSYPTDTSGPLKGIELGVAVNKPWYTGLMPRTVGITGRATCSYLPG
jgi:subtilisin family serine protease